MGIRRLCPGLTLIMLGALPAWANAAPPTLAQSRSATARFARVYYENIRVSEGPSVAPVEYDLIYPSADVRRISCSRARQSSYVRCHLPLPGFGCPVSADVIGPERFDCEYLAFGSTAFAENAIEWDGLLNVRYYRGKGLLNGHPYREARALPIGSDVTARKSRIVAAGVSEHPKSEAPPTPAGPLPPYAQPPGS